MQTARGYTLVETVTATAVAAALAVAAAPSLSNLTTRHRLALTVNELLLAIDVGRSEALAKGTRVVLAPKTGADWSSGWRLYQDLNDNGRRESDEPVLREFQPAHPRVRFAAHGMVATRTMSFEESGLVRAAGSNAMMLGRLNVELDGRMRTLCFAAARVRVVADRPTCS